MLSSPHEHVHTHTQLARKEAMHIGPEGAQYEGKQEKYQPKDIKSSFKVESNKTVKSYTCSKGKVRVKIHTKYTKRALCLDVYELK